MINPSGRDRYVTKVVSAARAIVTYEVGLPRGCQRLGKALYWPSPFESELPTIVNEYLDAVRFLPIGRERLEWNREALKERDIKLEFVNQSYRDAIFEICWALIDRFGKSKHAKDK